MLIPGSLIFIILLALVSEFINGMHESSTIIGVRASERFSKVRWGVAGDILTVWVIAVPVSALFSA